MAELSWVGKARKFTKIVQDQNNVVPVKIQMELRHRSDGIMYYLLSQLMNDKIHSLPVGLARERYLADLQGFQDRRWAIFLGDVPTGIPAVSEDEFKLYKPAPEWTEVTE